MSMLKFFEILFVLFFFIFSEKISYLSIWDFGILFLGGTSLNLWLKKLTIFLLRQSSTFFR